MSWRKGFGQPLGLTLLLLSAGLALAARLEAPWQGREGWLLLWGVAAYLAIATAVAMRQQPDAPLEIEAPRAPVDMQSGDFVRLTEEALRHLNSPAALLGCELIRRLPLTLAAAGNDSEAATPLRQAQLLRSVIEVAIQRLRPATGNSNESEALQYLILHDEYVLNRPNSQIISRHSISESTFHRHRREAIRALAAELEAREALLPDSAEASYRAP